MEKEMNEKKKSKSITKKAKKIRSIVMMSLLCVLMLSAATYAWFTLSNTAKVANLTMTVGDVTGLQIAPDKNGTAGTYGSVIDMEDILTGEGKLLPATTKDGKIFYQPTYDDNGDVIATTVEGEELALDSASTDTGHYIKYTFWLKSLGEAAEVKLKAGTGVTDGLESGATSPTGTYVLSTNVTDNIPGSAAVRMSFVLDDGSVAVYEPNNDITNKVDEGTETRAKDNRTSDKTAVGTTISQTKTGVIEQNTSGAYESVVSLEAGVGKKIILYIWIEGTDNQCSNEIASSGTDLKEIKAQLQFTTDADPNTTTTN